MNPPLLLLNINTNIRRNANNNNNKGGSSMLTKTQLKKYFWNILISIDQLFNTILFGDPDETMSSRFGKWLDKPENTIRYKIASVICYFLRKIDPNHCRRSIEKDEGDRAVIE